MTVRISRLAGAVQLTAATATYYTTPAVTSAAIKRAVFCNTTGGAVTITVYVVASGGAAGAANTVIQALSIGAGVTYVSPELAGVVFGPGDTLQASASANTSITMTVSGITVV